MNAIELLKTDHQKVKDIFSQLEPTTERALKTRQELFAKLKQELDIHALIEEQIFYPAIKDAEQTHEITLEAYEEHHVVKEILAELEGMSPGSEEWKAKLTVLQENVEHHVEEEEGEMFKNVKKVLDADTLDALGEEMQLMKQENKARSAGSNG